MVVQKNSNYWRALINDMNSAPLSDDGDDPPEMEKLPSKGRPRKKDDLPANQRKVVVQKVTTEVYIMSDIDNKKFASVSKQQTSIIGEMTLEDAMKMANNTES